MTETPTEQLARLRALRKASQEEITQDQWDAWRKQPSLAGPGPKVQFTVRRPVRK